MISLCKAKRSPQRLRDLAPIYGGVYGTQFEKPSTNKYLVGERVLDVVDLGEDGVGDGGGEGEEPERRDDLARPPQPRHGVRVQRVADRQVPE